LASRKLANDTAEAVVVKDAGEDINATNKIEITATVKLTGDSKVTIKSGKGMGKVTKPGLQVPIGESAINPVPRSMITTAVKEVLPAGKGVEVTITALEGEKIATKTLNAKLDIIGVSILGTTGVVKPLSLEACGRSLVPQIDVALARGYKRVFFVPGNIIYEVKDAQIT
jgi:cobalt-precorrin-5B (C1)-methyltransferase